MSNLRTVRIFRYDQEKPTEGFFQTYQLAIDNPDMTTILDVLLRIQKEQDPSIAFRYACRVNMCGSCGMVINGIEGLACKTNVKDLPNNQDITLRPLNHFPIIKDLVVDMGPFFDKYEDTLPFFEPKEKRDEPYVILPIDKFRQDIGMATDCIACGCCVSSCTMVNDHGDYAGPASLNRAFTLLADERDALFEPRLTRALESCFQCRTELNCTEVCPKKISGTQAIKYIQRLALKNLSSLKPIGAEEEVKAEACAVATEATEAPVAEAAAKPTCGCAKEQAGDFSRRTFLKSATGIVGISTGVVLTGILGASAIGPTTGTQAAQWVPVGKVDDFAENTIKTVTIEYERKNAFHTEKVVAPVIARRDSGDDFIFFNTSCPHLGCAVLYDQFTNRFECACHGGAFDIDGNVTAGPPPEPLPRLPWKIQDNIVMVEVV